MKIATFVISVVLFLFTFSSAIYGAISPSPSPVPAVSSFELFWPVVPGRTMGDSLYSLKVLKENIRGILIFGKPQKAEYEIFLATKRVAETEKLLAEGKGDLAKRTLEKMSAHLSSASSNVAASGGQRADNVDAVNKKLDSLEIFLAWLASKNEGAKDQLLSVLDEVKRLNQGI